MKKIKAVVFDLDGVYFESGTENFISALQKKFGLDREDIEKVYFKSKEMQSLKKGEISDTEFWNFARGNWNIKFTDEEIIDLLISGYSVKPEIDSLVEDLRRGGIKTAICTNNFPSRFENLAKKFKLEEKFDVIVTSYNCGITKPDKKIFNLLAKELQLHPSEIFMSDDREDNVSSLLQLGFHAFLFTSLDDFIERVNVNIWNARP